MQEIAPSLDRDPIVIRKRPRRGHERRHGAWKVAFADFVTAMMALFMVMWLMSAQPDTRDAVAEYFDDPSGYRQRLAAVQGRHPGSTRLNQNDLAALASEIEAAISGAPEIDEALLTHVEISVEEDGLRIELLENEQGLFFRSGSASPTLKGADVIRLIASRLKKMPNPLVIEGHTDGKPYRGRPSYGNWELSADRANSARRILNEAGIQPSRIVEVRGFAAMNLRRPESPDDPSNRRVSLILQYGEGSPPPHDLSPAAHVQ